jgi:hypothetical protein
MYRFPEPAKRQKEPEKVTDMLFFGIMLVACVVLWCMTREK